MIPIFLARKTAEACFKSKAMKAHDPSTVSYVNIPRLRYKILRIFFWLSWFRFGFPHINMIKRVVARSPFWGFLRLGRTNRLTRWVLDRIKLDTSSVEGANVTQISEFCLDLKKFDQQYDWRHPNEGIIYEPLQRIRRECFTPLVKVVPCFLLVVEEPSGEASGHAKAQYTYHPLAPQPFHLLTPQPFHEKYLKGLHSLSQAQ
jgi:hypothetical protein